MFKELSKLVKIIKKNKSKDPKISYTASLLKKRKVLCVKKFMEEARELAASSKYSNKKKYSSRGFRFIISFFSSSRV